MLCLLAKILFPTMWVFFQKGLTLLFPDRDCSRFPRLEMNIQLYADMLRNVPIHSLEQFEHFLNVTSGNFDSSQSTPRYLSKSKKSKKAASLLDLLHSNRPLFKDSTKAHQANPKDVLIDMVDLSLKERNKRRNSCQAAFNGASDQITTADIEVHNPLCSTLDESTLKNESTPKEPTFSDLAKDRHKPATPQPDENDSPV